MCRANDDFCFVVASDPEGFQSSENKRRVKVRAIKSYLDVASKDPTSTDKRIYSRRQQLGVARHKGVSSSRESPLSLPQTPSPEPKWIEPRAQAILRAASTAYLWQEDPNGVILNPLVDAIPGQNDFATLLHTVKALSLENDAKACKAFTTSLLTSMQRSHLRRHFDTIDVLEDRSYWSGMSEDVFASLTSVNLTLMRVVGLGYFTSLSHVKRWVPMVLKSREAHLSAYCACAPFVDFLLDSSSPADVGTPVPRHTMKVLSVLARVIHDLLSDPMKCNSDETIIAVVHLLYCHMQASEETLTTQAHRNILRKMIIDRGGLDHLGGGDGLIASIVIILNFQAAIWQDEPVESLYKDWIDSHPDTLPQPGSFTAGGLLVQTSNGMKAIARDRFCSQETLEIIQLTAQMIDLVYETINPKLRSPESTVGETREVDQAALQEKIEYHVERIHSYPAIPQTHDLTPQQSIYESVRLVSLRWAHAISNRRSLYEDVTCNLTIAGGTPCSNPSPAQIYAAVKQSPMNPAWFNLISILHWVLLTGINSCKGLTAAEQSWDDMFASSDMPFSGEPRSKGKARVPRVSTPRPAVAGPSARRRPRVEVPRENAPTGSAGPSYERTERQRSSPSSAASPSDTNPYRMIQFFKVHAARTCSLLQFQYPETQIKALRKMETMLSWLREGSQLD